MSIYTIALTDFNICQTIFCELTARDGSGSAVPVFDWGFQESKGAASRSGPFAGKMPWG